MDILLHESDPLDFYKIMITLTGCLQRLVKGSSCFNQGRRSDRFKVRTKPILVLLPLSNKSVVLPQICSSEVEFASQLFVTTISVSRKKPENFANKFLVFRNKTFRRKYSTPH